MIEEAVVDAVAQTGEKPGEEAVISADALIYYADHAYEFVMDQVIWPARRVLGGDLVPTRDQKYILDALPHEPRIAIESGHGTGKSTTFAWAGMWFLITRMNRLGHLVKVPVLAPTFHQLNDVVWPEFKRWIPLSRLGRILECNNYEVWVTGLKDAVWARARSPHIPGHIQGNHATHLLWLIDEAFGITDTLTWETIEGSLTEDDNRLVIGGQHTTITGYVHDAFNKDKANWHTGRFDSEKSPLVKQAYCQRIARRYGMESDIYRVRVKGMAPRGNPDAFIQLEKVDRAVARNVKGAGDLYMGIDPARFGDDSTVITIRHGFYVYPQVVLGQSDTDQIVNATLHLLRRTRKETGVHSKCSIMIGNSGGWGSGTIDALNKNTTDNIEVVPVNEAGDGNDDYANAVTLMWAEARDMLDHMQIPDDDALKEELATRRYTYAQDKYKGLRIILEEKKTFKKDYGSSPDHADSFVFCCTKQGPAKRVWNYYISSSPLHHNAFPIAWDKLEDGKFQVYVTLVYDKNTGIYGSFFFWGRESRKLYIYDELCDPNPVLTRLGVAIKNKAVVPLAGPTKVKVSQVYGSETMFGKGDTVQRLLRRQGVPVKPNPRYDLPGAIALVDLLFSRNQVVLHRRIEECDKQYRSWVVVNGKPTTPHPFCLNLCLVASVLREQRELEAPMPLKPYGKQKQAIRKRLREGVGYPKVGRREYDWLTK